jgi:Mg-chelatase subunit ChlD
VRTIEPDNPDQLVELARHFLGGGTNIAAALSRAATAVSDMAAKGDKGADVVVVTDGEDGRLDRSEGDGTGRTCGEAALDAIEALGSRLWTVAIDCDVTGILRDRAAKYVHVGAGDMRDERSVSKLADAV